MSAVLFGSISTIADTSEMQREAYNEAFKEHGLDWRWDREEYLAMLEGSGGQNRIAEYATSLGQSVDAEAVHDTKSEIFQKRVAESGIAARSGVVETIEEAKSKGVKVGLVTTTSPDNVASLIEALSPDIQTGSFDVIVDSTSVEQPKPDKAAYVFALERLGEQPDGCVAIEDNLGGVEGAKAAGLSCIAFPNQNTAGHDFDGATHRVDRLSFSEVQTFIPNR